MHRILIVRHDAAELADLRAALAPRADELELEPVRSLGQGLIQLAQAREVGRPFSAAVVPCAGPTEALQGLWEAEPDLQVALTLGAGEDPEAAGGVPEGLPGRLPVLLRRPFDALVTRRLVLALLEKRELSRQARDEHESVSTLRSSNRRLEQATRAKSEFLANMSHEIRTPMTAILGYADLLREPGLPRGEFHTYLSVIRRNGDHLLRVINDILDLSKIEAGRMEIEPAECSLRDLLDEVVSAMGPAARQKGLEFGVRYEGSLPASIRTDAMRTRQILLNLVGNAIKFTRAGGVRITARTASDGKRLALVVEDTGIGLDVQKQTSIFGAFSQADSSTTRQFGGTGLGLTISRRFAHILGGGIEVESEPGRGSAFTFTLDPGEPSEPRLLSSAERLEASTTRAGRSLDATPHDATAPGALRTDLGARVLLCEDGRDNQLLLRFYLRKAGCEVELAADGAQALERLRAGLAGEEHYDLVLMDMQMPKLDGYGVTRTARSEGWSGPIVALTAHAMPGDRSKCLSAGCDEYLTKPVDRARLIATCAQLIGSAAEAPLPSKAASPDISRAG